MVGFVPTLLLKPEGSRDRLGVVTPTLSGGVLVTQGQYGQAWQVAEATTNLFTNPTLLTNSAGWGQLNPVTASNVLSDHPDFPGINMRKVTTPGAVGGEGQRVSTPTGGLGLTTTARTFAGQFWFRGEAGVPFYSQLFAWYDTGGVQTYSATQINWVATGDWQHIVPPVVTSVTDGRTLSHILMDVGRVPDKRATTWYALAPQIEEKAYITPIAHGAMGAGHAWTGAAHASSSTRTAGKLSAPASYFPAQSGSILIRAKVTPKSDVYLFNLGGGHRICPNVVSGPDRWSIYTARGGGPTWPTFPSMPVPTQDATYYVEWDDTGEGMAINGGAVESFAFPYISGSWDSPFEVGDAYGPANTPNGAYDSILVFDRPLTYDERTFLLTMPRAWEWDALFPPASPALPVYRSQVYAIAPRIHTATRDNVIGQEITHLVTHAAVDADIDRTGPKSQLAIATVDPSVVPANGWIAPFLDVVPEIGDAISAQMGLYRLGQPVLADDGVGRVTADTTGYDIIATIDRRPLTAPQVTPVGANVMQAVRDALTALGLTRQALPADPRTATSAIAHKANTSWLTRINDLLAAIGYHALYATRDGRVTSRPLRDARQDTPARTYITGRDSRIVDGWSIRPSTGNVYNVVVAVKEDLQAGTALVAVARNDDPEHEWSTVNVGEIAPPEPVTSTDAVDQDALQALADDKLARSSMQEDIALAVLPDTLLGVHDVIEIVGTDGPEAGRWSVESIAWGLTADDPLVRIGARRTLTGRTA